MFYFGIFFLLFFENGVNLSSKTANIDINRNDMKLKRCSILSLYIYSQVNISCNRNGYALDGEKMTISAPCKRYFNQIFNENSSFWKYFTKFKLQNPICESFEACKFEKSHTLLQLQTNLFQHTQVFIEPRMYLQGFTCQNQKRT